MYKVLIVEDEPAIRIGLARHPIWSELGCGQALEADDGTGALDLVAGDPDIRLVVTDIRMKKMSGLTLIAQLYDTLAFEGKVIVLSGYDDFEYARAAMAYGVVDYLLKPVDMAELAAAAARTLERLKREERQHERLRLMDNALPRLQEELLQRLAEGPSRVEAATALRLELESRGLSWLASDRLAVLVLEADNLRVPHPPQLGAADPGLAFFAIGNVAEFSLYEYASRIGPYARFRSSRHDRWIVIFGEPPAAEDADQSWLDELERLLGERMRTFVKIGVTVAAVAGAAGTPADELYRNALEKLNRIRLYGSADEEAQGAGGYREVDALSGAQPLVDLLRYGQAADVTEAMSHFPRLVREWHPGSVRDLHRRTFDWLLELFETARKAGWKEEHWRRNPILLWEQIQAYDTVEALQSYAEAQLLQVHEALREAPRSQVLQQAEKYIREHFTEPLTVQAIAEHVFVTPEWLSTLFKKSHDCTVLDYITRLRMEKAKELLKDVGLKIYQIGGMVGYKDAVYFSRLFRRLTGTTPKEYRNQWGIPADD